MKCRFLLLAICYIALFYDQVHGKSEEEQNSKMQFLIDRRRWTQLAQNYHLLRMDHDNNNIWSNLDHDLDVVGSIDLNGKFLELQQVHDPDSKSEEDKCEEKKRREEEKREREKEKEDKKREREKEKEEEKKRREEQKRERGKAPEK